MTPCARTPGCPGVVDETGYCAGCGLAPLAEPDLAAPGAVGPAGGDAESRGGWTVANLVALPTLALSPGPVAEPDLTVPAHSRVCGACRHPIGPDGGDGAHPPDRGYCPDCGTPFQFVPDLRPGDVVGGQYEVVRCLARGGLGWVYLAEDTHLDRDQVALKGVIDKADPQALQAAVSERRFLITLNHPNLVRIRDFVVDRDRASGEPAGYIVMEYLAGAPLSELCRAALDPGRPEVTLPLDHILAYGHEILAALDYLHRRNLLYTDVKPNNVIRTADGVKLIDLGSVRHVDDRDSPVVHAPGFQVDARELAERGPTVRSDLHAVGVTLAELFRARTPGPDGADGADGVAVEAFQRLVDRAAHRRWERRFASAADLAAQLVGVMRDVVPARVVQRQPELSGLFAPMAELLDAGLGTVPPLRGFTAGAPVARFADGRPDGPTAAERLPTPQSPPQERGAAVLEALGTLDPGDLLARLAALGAASAEVELIRCRAYLRLADPGGARRAIGDAEALLAADAPDRWRLPWHRGLLALAEEDPAAARQHFDEVYADLPGETAPRLALAYCAERLGDRRQAERLYRSVWRRDRLQASAAFGLARLRLAVGARAEAVAELDGVPRLSGHFEAARTAAVRVLAARLGTDGPSAAALNQAVERTASLRLDGGDRRGPARDRMVTLIRQAALDRVRAHGPARLAPGEVLGAPPGERTLRALLEGSFRALAAQATTREEHDVLIDQANSVRPWSRR